MTNEYDGPHYTKVRNDFLERSDLTTVEKLILIWLHGRMPRLDGLPWDANNYTIKTALNLGHDATDKALASLVRKGWLDNAGRNESTGKLAKSTLAEWRHGEVIAPDAKDDDVSAGETFPGKPGRENPEGISRTGKPGSNEGLSMKDSPHEATVPEVDETTGLIRATCSCGGTGPWREPREQLQITADYREHKAAFEKAAA
jgi:hypothetical protein